MADAFKFELVAPERLVLSADVRSVVIPGSEGEMTVLAHHAPVMTTLRAGVLAVDGDGGARRIFVRGGFAEIGTQGLTVLAEEAIAVEEIDRARVEAEIKDARDDLAEAKSEDERRAAAARIERLMAMAAAA